MNQEMKLRVRVARGLKLKKLHVDGLFILLLVLCSYLRPWKLLGLKLLGIN